MSDTWTGFTRFTVLDEKTTRWIHMVPTDKEANDIQARLLVARDMEVMSEASKRTEKQKWTIEKNEA